MKVDVLGVKINSDSKRGVLEKIEARLDSGESVFIVTPYSESLVAAQSDEEFRNILNSADFALPDGAGVVWAARILSPPSSPGEGRNERRGRNLILERIPGREFFWDLCALAEKRGEPIFLLGGFRDTPDLVAAKLKEKFPKLKLAGNYNGPPLPFSLPSQGEGRDNPSLLTRGEVGRGVEEDKLVQIINSSHASFLFVALGPVAQEKWIYHNLAKLRVKLAMGVGGTFDYIAGKKPLPPQFLASHGLEWLWRLVTQPWRAWRITKGVLGLIWYIARARMK